MRDVARRKKVNPPEGGKGVRRRREAERGSRCVLVLPTWLAWALCESRRMVASRRGTVSFTLSVKRRYNHDVWIRSRAGEATCGPGTLVRELRPCRYGEQVQITVASRRVQPWRFALGQVLTTTS